MDDLQEIKQDVKEIKEVVIKNTVSLDMHMKRTELNERRIESMERWTLGLLTTALIAALGRLLFR